MAVSQSLPKMFGRVWGNQRSRTVLMNTIASGAMKGCSLLCSLIMVPLTISYLNPENYGIWMAMTSVLYWFVFMDVGLGNGMRNYLAIYFSQGETSKARSCFTTAMLLLTVIAIAIAAVAIPLINLSDLNYVFSAHNVSGKTLAGVLTLAVVLSLMQFVVKNIGIVYMAMQKYAVNDLILFIGNIMTVVIVFVLTRTTEGNLAYVVAAFTAVPVIAYSIAAVVLLRSHPELRPTAESVDMALGREIVTKGLGFFAIQITSCLVIFGSANILISHYCGPEQVTVYNVPFKLFNVLIIGYTILISPMWNAYTDAAVKGDYAWIRRCFHRSLQLWCASVVAGLALLCVSGWFIRMWVGRSVAVPLAVSACILAYVCAFNLNNCATYLVNGMNKIRIQVITSVAATAAFLAAIYVAKGSYGIVGITLAMAAAYLAMSAVHLYQCHLLINQKAKGIWNK